MSEAEMTDAEKLAAARAAMFAAAEAAKAALLPSAQAALAFLEGPEAVAFQNAAAAIVSANLDDISGGCKRALERIVETVRISQGVAAQRVQALQPAPAPEAPAAPEA